MRGSNVVTTTADNKRQQQPSRWTGASGDLPLLHPHDILLPHSRNTSNKNTTPLYPPRRTVTSVHRSQLSTFLLAAAAEAIALACISVISGYTTDSRQPRKPSMGFTSCSWATRSLTTDRGLPTVSARDCQGVSMMKSTQDGGWRKRVVGC